MPEDFRFNVDGQQLSGRQLTVGMKGTATITTRTTVTPVTVTEVKNGTVALHVDSNIMVQTPEGVKSFTQGDVDKRGVKVYSDGKPVLPDQSPRRQSPERNDHHVTPAAGHDGAGSSGGYRPGRRRGARIDAGRRDASAGAANRTGSGPRAAARTSQNAAEHCQRVADARARKRNAGRDGANPQYPGAAPRARRSLAPQGRAGAFRRRPRPSSLPPGPARNDTLAHTCPGLCVLPPR